MVRAAGGVFAPGHLGELTRIVPFEMVDAVLDSCAKTQRRIRLVPARVTVYLLLAAGLFAHLGWGLVWDKLTAGLGPGPRPGASALYYARKRLGAAPLRALFDHLAGPGAACVRWRGLLVVALDGTQIEVPDSAANRDRFGLHSAGHARAGYPQVRLLALAAAGTRSLLGATWSTTGDTEQYLARSLLPHLGPGRLLLADRGFASADFLARATETGTDLLVRIPAHWRPRTIKRLSEGTRLVQIGPLQLRLIEAEITINTTGATRTGAYRLATTLTDPAAHPALDLVELYHQRWEIETAFMELKSTLLRRRVLRAADPAGLDQELWALLVLYQAVRCAIDDACTASDLTPLTASFTLAIECARDQIIQAAGIIDDEHLDLAGRIGAELIARPLPKRRLRTAPRAIKRAISKHRAKGTVNRRTYKATLEIALIDTR
ncbi:IS4 family transposase [Glycomyces sp. A-F 0318]|uniref:IS4 family transposase n=1 Tax=Glycomyces amatae TaxID=2881355 RepID=UPI001E48B4A6|nr:IS4 family transposase [Glycomyces amatae]